MLSKKVYSYLKIKCKECSEHINKSFGNEFDFFIDFINDNKIIINNEYSNKKTYKLNNMQYNNCLQFVNKQ